MPQTSALFLAALATGPASDSPVRAETSRAFVNIVVDVLVTISSEVCANEEDLARLESSREEMEVKTEVLWINTWEEQDHFIQTLPSPIGETKCSGFS